MLALCAGLATAQVGGSSGNNNPLSCTSGTGSVTPSLRSEGFTEQSGDTIITCVGGPSVALGSLLPTVNIQIFLNTQVTSRLLGNVNGPTNASEALLLIDEPGNSGLSGYGPAQAQILCATPASGCPTWVGNSTTGGMGVMVGANPNTGSSGSFNPAPVAVAPNVYQGVVMGNSVTFFGVPVLPPASGGNQRVFRITNVRGNANGLGGGTAAGVSQMISSISVSGATSLPIANPTQVVGFVQSGLSSALRSLSNGGSPSSSSLTRNQCNTTPSSGSTPQPQVILRFSENFGTAFKTRVVPTAATANSGQSGVAVQNTPGGLYSSESNFTSPVSTSIPQGNGFTAGLADFGTRLKAVFNNIPAGVNIFVSTNNITNVAANISPPPGGAGSNSTSSFAQLVVSETASDGSVGGGFAPTVASTTTNSGVPLAQLAVVNGSASAVWEVVNTNPATQESLDFGVYITYTAAVGTNSPPPGTGTVSMSFAPNPTQGAFSATAGPVASGSLPIPRFADTSTATNFLTIVICQTDLLFPFVTNQAGFDTGLAISNTSTDPLGTAPQAGTCTLSWYGSSAPATYLIPSPIASGTSYAALASVLAPGFQGYVIAVCNFQYAHGFAFVSDVGARNLAMGYLALVLNGSGGQLTNRGPTAEGIAQ
jgi:hypothetical protein